AEIERTTVEIEAVNGARTAELRAVGSVVRFDGFIAAYTEQKDEDSEDEENRRLPEIRAGEQLDREAINATQHTTEPPPRYSEASLIKKLEELGIGRPSTYTA
ncbi:DNA topoisomerase, partial [Mesorhizobium sp.]